MVELLEREHPEYRNRKEMWQRYWDFYVGGEQLRRNASLYLVRRQKEPNDVYAERLSRVFYENYLGSCIDWYAATLFRSQPVISVQGGAAETRGFYSHFINDANRRGTSLVEVMRKLFIETLVFGESYALLDFPIVEDEAENRAQEDALGKSRAYLVPYSPTQLINWRTDGEGSFEWIVLKKERLRQGTSNRADVVREERWAFYDRERFQIFSRQLHQDRGGTTADKGEAELVSEGRHALADVGMVPLVRMAVSDGLWLANKASLLAQEHFNKSNALSWALHMGLFAMPVIYSEREWQQIVGEAYYIQLGPNDRFGWTEPEGHVFKIAAENLDRLKDEIYRVCYLMTQAGGREARHLGQSGESKRRDFAVTHEILRGYGSVVKDVLRRVFDLVSRARRDEVEIGISGMDQFDIPSFAEELEHALGLQQLGIRSSRLEKEMQKRVALKYLEGSTQETRDELIREIEGQ